MTTPDPTAGMTGSTRAPELSSDAPLVPARGLGDIVSDLTGDLSRLFRDEVELAKVELRQEAQKAGQAAIVLVGAALLALIALLILAMALGFLIADVGGDEPAFSLGFFIAGLLFLIGAGIAGVVGRNRLSQVNPKPEQTIETLRQDREFLKERQ